MTFLLYKNQSNVYHDVDLVQKAGELLCWILQDLTPVKG